jgi:hypothetical protein
MKWIKTAIGAVIAISFVPFVVLSVINIKEPLETTEEITITFELEYLYPQFKTYRFNHTLQIDDWNDYFEKGYTITNLYDYTNDINITITDYTTVGGNIQIIDNNSVSYLFYDEYYGNYGNIDQTYDSVYNTNATDIVCMNIILTKKPFKHHKLVATLISFVPIIFVGGVLFYFYKPFKEVTGR